MATMLKSLNMARLGLASRGIAAMDATEQWGLDQIVWAAEQVRKHDA